MFIQGIKLITGEELVAEVTSESSSEIVVKRPLVVLVGQGKDGFIINFMPWSVLADGELTIEKRSIVTRYDVPADVVKNYTANVTGLQIVDSAPSILHG